MTTRYEKSDAAPAAMTLKSQNRSIWIGGDVRVMLDAVENK